MSEQPVPRRYSLGISSIPPVEDTDGEAAGGEAETEVDEIGVETETEQADEEPPEP